jgi:large conductance mechanosensitive channel
MDPIKSVSALDPTKKAFSLFEEFKQFAFKGNVIELAVGVIIGAAFGKIIDSLVKHLLMPMISVVMPGEQGYLGWKWVINGKEIPYGLFIGEVVNFLIVALALFIFIVKFLGWIMKSKKEEATAPPPLTGDQELLTEIRDLLNRRCPTGRGVRTRRNRGQRPQRPSGGVVPDGRGHRPTHRRDAARLAAELFAEGGDAVANKAHSRMLRTENTFTVGQQFLVES